MGIGMFSSLRSFLKNNRRKEITKNKYRTVSVCQSDRAIKKRVLKGLYLDRVKRERKIGIIAGDGIFFNLEYRWVRKQLFCSAGGKGI